MSLLPTASQLKRDFWRPDDHRVLVRKAWGWGYTVNFAAVARRFGRGRTRSS